MTEPTETTRCEETALRVSDAEPTGSPRRGSLRRFFRFNLLTALVLFLLVSAYFGVRQRFVVSLEAIAAKKVLAKHSATVVERPAAPVWLRDVLLMHGEAFQHVEEVSYASDDAVWIGELFLTYGQQKDRVTEDLEALTKLPRLRSVDLTGRDVDDETLSYLARSGSLQEIRWSQAAVNDAGIARLTTLRELRSIALAGSFTTDRSLEILAELPEIESIVLDDSTTERGIAALLRYPKLKRVDASATALTGEEFAALVERGIEVTLPMNGHTRTDDADAPVVAYLYGGQRAHGEQEVNPLRLAIGPQGALDEKSQERFDARGDGMHLQFLSDRRVSDEALRLLIRDPRVVSVQLPAVGSPYRFEEARGLLAARPADAPRCRIDGHVLISGEALFAEAKGTNASSGYIVYDVSPTMAAALRSAGVTFIGDRALRIPVFLYPEDSRQLGPIPVEPAVEEPDA